VGKDQIIGRFPLSRALHRLAHPSPAVRYALKFGTTMAAALWFAYSSELSDKVTIFITVLFVMQPTSGGSIKKGVPRIAGTVACALMCVLIYGMFVQLPPLFLASWCAVIAVGTYGMTGARYPYAWMVFAFTSVIILVKAMAGDDQIETIAFQRASETVMGVLLVVVADSLFWPVRAEPRLREGLAHWAGQLAAALRRALGPQTASRGPSQQAQLPSSPLIPQLGLVDQLGYEIGVSAARVQTFTRIGLLLEGLSSRIRVIEREAMSAERTRSSAQGLALATLGDHIAVAITRASQALTGDRSPDPFSADLDQSLASFEKAPSASSEGVGEGSGAALELEDLRAVALSATLRDAVAVLRNLESSLAELAAPENGSRPSLSHVTWSAGWSWFRPDPIRVQLALRAAIAAAGALIATLAMGWGAQDQLAVIMAVIVAFIFAGMSSTRGAAGTIAPGLVAGILLGWLVVDLAIVYLLPHLSRMPMVLMYPFAVAGLAGYLIARGSPLGPLGALFGLVTAILPVFSVSAAPQDVYGPYSLVCGLMLGVAAGFMAQRFLWPRTAMQTFLQRSAGQLDLCAQAVRGENGVSSSRSLARLLSAYAKQLTLLLQLHQQASREPVERALADERRSKLLALTQGLFDASIRSRREFSAITENRDLVAEIDFPLTPLSRALIAEDEALIHSMTLAAGALREDDSRANAGLGEAHAQVEAQIEALRGRDDVTALDRQQIAQLISGVASRRILVEAQLQIEAWIADWQTAAGGEEAV
jgi:uncharacterized membrane protein YccC